MTEEKALVKLCGTVLFRNGAPTRFDPAAASKKMKSKEITLEVSLGQGEASCTMLTCDFSYDYVRINAEYHT